MKKSIIKITGFALFALAMMFNVILFSGSENNSNNVSLVALGNTAYAQNEGGPGGSSCYQTLGYCGWFSSLSWKCTPNGNDGACRQYYCETC